MPDPIITPLIDNTNSNDPVVALVQHRDVTMSDIQAYRKEHACSLGEACRALGWRGNRMYRVSDLGPNGELPFPEIYLNPLTG